MNQAILKGNVGQDPRITQFESGKVAQFSLATTERGYTTRDGRQIPEHTDWHNIVVNRDALVEGAIEKYVKKGTPILVTGKLRTREYTDDNGFKRYITEIVVDSLELCGGKENMAPGFAPASA